MKRLVVLLALCGCAQHPVVTVSVAAGSVALLTCEVNQLSFWATPPDQIAPSQGHVQGTCGILTAGVALVLGGLTALVTTFADTNAHALPPDEEMLPNGVIKLHTHTELPPVPLDAGVPDAAPPPQPIDAAAPPD